LTNVWCSECSCGYVCEYGDLYTHLYLRCVVHRHGWSGGSVPIRALRTTIFLEEDDGEQSYDDGQEGFNDDGQEGFNDDGQEGFNDDGQEGFNDDGQEGFNDDGQEGFNDDGQEGFNDIPRSYTQRLSYLK
jgi:hypothetical protein